MTPGPSHASVQRRWARTFGRAERTLYLWLGAVFTGLLAAAASGAVGGVFTPTLFVGATGGYVLAHVAASWLGAALVGDPRVMAVIGMAAVLAAVTHAPLMAIVMVLEITNQFQLTVPVMLACGVAYAVSTRFGAHPLYGNPIEGHEPTAQRAGPAAGACSRRVSTRSSKAP